MTIRAGDLAGIQRADNIRMLQLGNGAHFGKKSRQQYGALAGGMANTLTATGRRSRKCSAL